MDMGLMMLGRLKYIQLTPVSASPFEYEIVAEKVKRYKSNSDKINPGRR
jgi:hypothetical protein